MNGLRTISLPLIYHQETIFSSKQSGNKQLHSTETSVIHTTNELLSAIDKKKLTAVVLLDMFKAFDSINHQILLTKLQDIVRLNL